MTVRDHLLVMLMEECDEVSQRASKALRFGLAEVQPGQELTNADRIVGELRDLLAIVELLQTDGAIANFTKEHPEHAKAILHKKFKVGRFLSYSNDLGLVDDLKLNSIAYIYGSVSDGASDPMSPK